LSCPVYQREALGADSAIAGPALVQEHGTTTVLFARDALTVAPSGELIISVGGSQ
jgi:N-methylhydantoinase A